MNFAYDQIKLILQLLCQLIFVITNKENQIFQPIAELHTLIDVLLPLIQLTNVITNQKEQIISLIDIQFQSILVFIFEFISFTLYNGSNVDQFINKDIVFILLFLVHVVVIQFKLFELLLVLLGLEFY